MFPCQDPARCDYSVSFVLANLGKSPNLVGKVGGGLLLLGLNHLLLFRQSHGSFGGFVLPNSKVGQIDLVQLKVTINQDPIFRERLVVNLSDIGLVYNELVVTGLWDRSVDGNACSFLKRLSSISWRVTVTFSWARLRLSHRV